ncbi:MAG: 4-hydroxy-3-methylbut-2-enyl diphosphate reductase, partial [Aestuariibacter sp.]|nr:4-hydroxy-3-methylbut-2-enyl diphosphate reductase [Aestuariibacter sp.]
QQNTTAYLIDRAEDIQQKWLESVKQVGVSAGASAPEVLVEEVVKRLNSSGLYEIKTLRGIEENVTFSLPKSLL